jgi:hypothetical protein
MIGSSGGHLGGSAALRTGASDEVVFCAGNVIGNPREQLRTSRLGRFLRG